MPHAHRPCPTTQACCHQELTWSHHISPIRWPPSYHLWLTPQSHHRYIMCSSYWTSVIPAIPPSHWSIYPTLQWLYYYMYCTVNKEVNILTSFKLQQLKNETLCTCATMILVQLIFYQLSGISLHLTTTKLWGMFCCILGRAVSIASNTLASGSASTGIGSPIVWFKRNQTFTFLSWNVRNE